jgi:ribosome hibernation promoting factor
MGTIVESMPSMKHVQESFPVRLRMRWLDFSPALQWYATRRVEIALRRFASRIREVNVLIADSNGPRGGADDKACEIDVHLQPSGSLTVSSAAPDAYLAVDRAVRRARAVVRGHVGRTREHRERAELSRIA